MREKIGQMLLVGFRGFEIEPGGVMAKNLSERNLGGIIYFDRDLTSGSDQRNVQSPAQVKKLSAQAKALCPTPLLVSVDQEGGFVTRLKPKHGFPKTLSALKMAGLPQLEFEREASQLAATVAEAGINLNFAPSVDLNLNPDNPVIGKWERSFSADPDVVTRKATTLIESHTRAGVLTAPKHFPGHGSSKGDTHLGMVDVTDTWKEIELEPFANLVKAGRADMVMTAHVFNRKQDATYPATLSPSVIRGILRDRMHFEGVVISDDMQMGAIQEHYINPLGLKEVLRLGLEADVDIFTFGNNVAYDEHIMEKAVDAIAELVREKKVSEERIEKSFARISKLKTRWLGPR